jgi:hypothetical protein
MIEPFNHKIYSKENDIQKWMSFSFTNEKSIFFIKFRNHSKTNEIP